MHQVGLKNNDIDILIISHNHGKHLDKCLKSIYQFSPKLNFSVILIVNNKYDKESIDIAKKYNVKLITNQKPQGLSSNINQGFKISKAPFILILNPDIILKKNSIEKMISFMKNNPKVGICGPKLLYPDGQPQPSARRFPNWKTFIVRRLPLLRIVFKNSKINKHHLYLERNLSKPQKVDWLLGAVLLLRRLAVEEIGLFDERYYLYCEDIDYCFRAWEKGWEIWYYPKAEIIHNHLAVSDKKFFSIYNLHHFRSMVFYYFKNVLRVIK